MKNTFTLFVITLSISFQAEAQRPHIVQQYKEANPAARVATPVDHTNGQARIDARGIGRSAQTMTAERATAAATAARVEKSEVVTEEASKEDTEELISE